jgi:hypothetical protein
MTRCNVGQLAFAGHLAFADYTFSPTINVVQVVTWETRTPASLGVSDSNSSRAGLGSELR